MTQPETDSPEPLKQLAISLIRNVRKGPDMDAGKFLGDVRAWDQIRPLDDPYEATTLDYLKAVVADKVRGEILKTAFRERIAAGQDLQLGRLLGLIPPESQARREADADAEPAPSAAVGESAPSTGLPVTESASEPIEISSSAPDVGIGEVPPEIAGDPELTRIYTGILQEEGGAEMGEKFLKAVRFMMSHVPGLDFKTAALRLIKREFREPNG